MRELPIAPPPSAADIGLVTALPMEIAPFLARLRGVRKYHARKLTIVEGELGGKLIVVVLTGMGRIRAQRGAEALLDGHRPRWLVSAGYAGALNPSLKRNEIVLADEVVNIEGRRFSIDVKVPETSRAEGIHAGRLLTTDSVARTALEKQGLREKFSADVVDMETSAIAALAGERGVRFLSIRVVSDEAGVNLPPEILSIVGETGSVRLGAAVGSLLKRPGALKDLLRLREHAKQAADRLSSFLVETLATLN